MYVYQFRYLLRYDASSLQNPRPNVASPEVVTIDENQHEEDRGSSRQPTPHQGIPRITPEIATWSEDRMLFFRREYIARLGIMMGTIRMILSDMRDYAVLRPMQLQGNCREVAIARFEELCKDAVHEFRRNSVNSSQVSSRMSNIISSASPLMDPAALPHTDRDVTNFLTYNYLPIDHVLPPN